MKKCFSFLIILLIAFGAQGKEKVKLQFGSRAGVNSSFSRSSPSGYSVRSQIGFNAGVYCHISNIWKKLYVQPEVDYYFNSYKYQESRIDGDEDRVNTHTIQIPITAGYTLIEKKRLYWRISTGPMISILAGVSDNDVGVTRDTYKPVVWSWRVETCLRIAKLTLNAGFDAGMSKVYEGSDVRANTWYAGIGFNL